ncbi:hypothetical protein CHELA1G11_10604 [Hyphomicrobiales bacterium]|nr:hypothetical protein CHELA1G11_10604 [Hyphomicrobiales bacterium]CAH1673506.1 hypothetical protein CHELA1G2_13699 [Hyphomicrobiales bacterium]
MDLYGVRRRRQSRCASARVGGSGTPQENSAAGRSSGCLAVAVRTPTGKDPKATVKHPVSRVLGYHPDGGRGGGSPKKR